MYNISMDQELRKKIDNLSSFPLIVKNFLSSSDIESFMSYLNKNENEFGELSNNYWDGRVISLPKINDTTVLNLLVEKRIGIMEIIESILKEKNLYHKLYSDIICFSKWPEGYELVPHADSELPHGQKHELYWRNFGAVMYLNSEYTGGEIFFPRLGLEIKPEVGMLAVFPGTLKYLHGVKKITSGTRHTIASFLTFDENKHDNYPR